MAKSEMPGKRVSESEVVLLHNPMPDETNNAGTMHGGHLLKLIDNAGAIVASRHTRRQVVTASLERMDFLTPVHPGELIILKASVNMTGTTSLEVGVRIEAENLSSGAVRHAATCYMTFVALDENGKPALVPPLIIEGEEENRRLLKAQERRRYRNMLRSKVNNLHLFMAPDLYAICHVSLDNFRSVAGNLLDKKLVLSLTSLSPSTFCDGLDSCSSNMLNPIPEIIKTNLSGGFSLVVKQEGLSLLPEGSQSNSGWRCLALYGPSVMLSHTGIIADLSSSLANANVSTFFISTFDGNFLFFKDQLLPTAVNALTERGYVLNLGGKAEQGE